ncbi:MAG: hypothetical protein WDW38_005185 [Sanguina aurantia]
MSTSDGDSGGFADIEVIEGDPQLTDDDFENWGDDLPPTASATTPLEAAPVQQPASTAVRPVLAHASGLLGVPPVTAGSSAVTAAPPMIIQEPDWAAKLPPAGTPQSAADASPAAVKDSAPTSSPTPPTANKGAPKQLAAEEPAVATASSVPLPPAQTSPDSPSVPAPPTFTAVSRAGSAAPVVMGNPTTQPSAPTPAVSIPATSPPPAATLLQQAAALAAATAATAPEPTPICTAGTDALPCPATSLSDSPSSPPPPSSLPVPLSSTGQDPQQQPHHTLSRPAADTVHAQGPSPQPRSRPPHSRASPVEASLSPNTHSSSEGFLPSREQMVPAPAPVPVQAQSMHASLEVEERAAPPRQQVWGGAERSAGGSSSGSSSSGSGEPQTGVFGWPVASSGSGGGGWGMSGWGLAARLKEAAVGAVRDVTELTETFKQALVDNEEDEEPVQSELTRRATDHITGHHQASPASPPHPRPTASTQPPSPAVTGTGPAPMSETSSGTAEGGSTGGRGGVGAGSGGDAAAAAAAAAAPGGGEGWVEGDAVRAAVREQVLQRLQDAGERGSSMEVGLKAIDEQVEQMASGAARAFTSLWGNLRNVGAAIASQAEGSSLQDAAARLASTAERGLERCRWEEGDAAAGDEREAATHWRVSHVIQHHEMGFTSFQPRAVNCPARALSCLDSRATHEGSQTGLCPSPAHRQTRHSLPHQERQDRDGDGADEGRITCVPPPLSVRRAGVAATRTGAVTDAVRVEGRMGRVTEST